MGKLPKLRPAVRLVDAVSETLKEAIFEGALKPGQQLSVPELSRQLDVSRSPVREAVLNLVANGLAVEQPRKGVVVVTIEASELLEIHQVREFAEALSARLCAERIDDAHVALLRQILDQQAESVEQNDADAYFSSNAQFHELIGRQAGNRRLYDLLQTLEGQMRVGLKRVSGDVEQRRRALNEHREILEAIAQRKPDAAEALMRRHISATKLQLEASLTSKRKPAPGAALKIPEKYR
ncbi:MAG: GntR family transcriptional regulator [Pseudomonadota bacterium]